MKRWLMGLIGVSTCLLLSAFVLAEDLSDVERDARALELYIQDKQDHKDYCPDVEWDQPALDIYKSTLESHLPEFCKS